MFSRLKTSGVYHQLLRKFHVHLEHGSSHCVAVCWKKEMFANYCAIRESPLGNVTLFNPKFTRGDNRLVERAVYTVSSSIGAECCSQQSRSC